MTPDSNTAKKKRGRGSGRPFTKGDPRINKNGRPKGFDQLRDLALKLCEEIKTNPKTGETLPAVEVILRQMMADPKQRKDFLEIAYGKVPQAVELERGWTADVAAAFAEIAAAIREKDG